MKFSTLRKALILLALVIAVAIPAAAFSGTGTSADPYVISSAEELKKMNNSSAYFKLGDNIKINDVSELFGWGAGREREEEKSSAPMIALSQPFG